MLTEFATPADCPRRAAGLPEGSRPAPAKDHPRRAAGLPEGSRPACSKKTPQAESNHIRGIVYRRAAVLKARGDLARAMRLIARVLPRDAAGGPEGSLIARHRDLAVYLLVTAGGTSRVQLARALAINRKCVQRMLARVEDRREADAGYDALIAQLEGAL